MVASASIDPITHMKANVRNVFTFFAVVGVAVSVGTALPVLMLYALENSLLFAQFSSVIGLLPPEPTKFMFPVAMTGVACLCLLVEAYGQGYERSTLFEIFEGKNASVRNDVFFLFMRVSGLALVLAFVMLFGAAGHVYLATKEILDFGFLSEINPLLQFIVLVFVLTFINYWYHRAFHSEWFYDLHKVHHSAEHYGVLLPFRVHPLNEFFSAVYTVGVLSLLGVHPAVMIAWVGLNGFYQCMVHSHIDWPEWTGIIVITPAMHRIHHSTEPRHFSKNLSILTLWDKLFGTFHPPETVDAYGVGPEEAHLFNTDHYLSEVIATFTRWGRGIFLRRKRHTL